MSGILKSKSKKPIVLVFDVINPSKKYYYSFEKDVQSKPLNFTKKDNKYYTKIECNSTKRDYLLISGGTHGLIEFKVIPTRSTSY